MPSGIELQLPVPKNWSDFEDICHSLWKRKWNDPEAHKHGRRGQAQQGVDVYGRRNAQGDYHGVQCKGKDGNLNSELSEKEIRHEVTEAKKFTPPLKTLIIATTAPNDAKAQNLARKISQENEKLGLFSVSVRGWDDIVNDLYDFHEVIDKHYPEHSSTIKNIGKDTEELIKTSQQTNLQISEMKDLLSGHLDQGWDGRFDKHLNEQVDQYVELTKSGKANTALGLLEKLKLSESYNTAKNRTKFRIEGNIGSAYLALGKYEAAADYLIAAFAFDPEYIKARCNHAYGQLLKENREEASKLALQCLKDHEDSKEAASIFILANIKNDKIQDIENMIPASLLDEADILLALGVFYREKENYEKQKDYTEKAFNKDPECEKIKQTYAEALIAPIFSDMSWVYSKMMTSRYKKDAVKASRILESVYNHSKQSEGKVFIDGIAINMCSTYRFLGENRKAREIIVDALKLTSENHDGLYMQLVYLALNEQDPVLGLDSLNKITKKFNEREFFQALFFLGSDQQEKAVLSFEKILNESKDDDLKVAEGVKQVVM
jgi:tetratricopeptide (TPR) repeat protein